MRNYFVVDRNGRPVPLDTTGFTDQDSIYFKRNSGVVSDAAYLRPIWLISIYQSDGCNFDDYDYDFITSVRLTHEPTPEELLYYLSKNNDDLHNVFCQVENMYELAYHYDDD